MEILDLSSPNIEALVDQKVQEAIASLVDQKVQEAIALVEPVPPGATFFYSGQTAPNGWLKANGASLDRVLFADLFNAIGTTYGSQDESSFNLPDLRGVAIRGWDDGRGLDSGRAFGSYQEDALQNITGTLNANRWGITALSGAIYYRPAKSDAMATAYSYYTRNHDIGFDASRVARTSTETRMKNNALLPIIKY